MLLLDTNVLSELRKVSRGKGDPRVAEWSRSGPADAAFISVLSIYEIQIGITRIEGRDPHQAGLYLRWLEESLLPNYAGRILPVTAVVARQAAVMQHPDPRPFTDTLIAATAIVHGLTVVTRNTADFRMCSAFNPFA
jgi:predicted nucleic acid-binding protein